MADSTVKALNRSALSWAVTQLLRFAVGTCVLSLVLATTLSGDGAERFATTAYLAAIAAASALVLRRVLPGDERRQAALSAPFPVFFGYSVGLVVLLSIVAMLVSNPGGEVLAFAACAALLVAGVLVRRGLLVALQTAMVRGGTLVATARYAVLACVLTFAIAAIVGESAADGLYQAMYAVMIAAALFLCATLISRTRAGAGIAKGYVHAAAWTAAHPIVFKRSAIYGAATAAAAMLPAAVLPSAYGEPFAILAYAAVVATSVAVAMECRRLHS